MAKLKVLVVEDTPKDVMAAKVALSEHDLTVVTGYDEARVALKLDQFNDRRYDQTILDGKSGRLEDEGTRELARKALAEPFELFDVVLTDCMLPKGGNKCMDSEGSALVAKQGVMPYGPIIVLTALEVGVKRVGIITSGNHHKDPFVFTFDQMGGFTLGNTKVVCTNSCDAWVDAKSFVKLPDDTKELEKVGAKDWALLLKLVLE